MESNGARHVIDASKTHAELQADFDELVDAAKQMVDANNAPGSRFTSVEQYDMHRQLCAVLLKVAGVRAAPFVSRSG